MIRLPSLRWPFLLVSMAIATAGAQEQTARLVKDANRLPGDFRAKIDWVMPAGGGAVFPQDTLSHGSELWFSDGTARGTRLLKDIKEGPGSIFPRGPVAFGPGAPAKLAFSSNYWANQDELWVTDGSEAGTVQVYNGPGAGYTSEVQAQAGTTGGVFFWDRNWDLEDPYELLFSDGTAAGTWSLNPLEGGSRARFSDPAAFVASGPWCYFIANENEIWRSDGTEAGTTKVVTVTEGWPNQLALAGGRLFIDVGVDPMTRELWSCPMEGGEKTRLGAPDGSVWGYFQEIAVLGGEVIFVTEDEVGTRELWASDGTTAGTRRILLAGPGQEEPTLYGEVIVWKGAAYFPAAWTDGRQELWRSDGTSGGTRRLMAFPQSSHVWTDLMPTSTDFLYFFSTNADGRYSLWRTQGDAASTRRVKGTPTCDPLTSNGPVLADTEAGILFAAGQSEPEAALWRLRHKTFGSVRLTRPEKSTGSGVPFSPERGLPYGMLDGSLLSFVHTGRGHELWRMNPDGSRARSIWKTPVPLENYGWLGFHGTLGGGAVFSFYDGADVRQVWVTDGTRRGTKLLGNHGVTTDNGYPIDFTIANGVCLYSLVHFEDPSKSSLWKTDGTPAGTAKVMAPDGSSPCPDHREMIAYQNGVCFLATVGERSTALWRSDGTTAGTVRVKNEWHGPNEKATGLSVVDGKLFFAVNLPNTQYLWQSDGTTPGTVAVSPLRNFARGSVSRVLDLGGLAIFQARRQNLDGYLQWWRHGDGVTRTVRDQSSGQQMYDAGSNPLRQVVAGTQLFYCGIEENDPELWVTDGTNDGTRRVKDILPGSFGSAPDQFLAVGNVVYFAAYDEEHGQELWRSDGTEAGTMLVADIEPGPESSWPYGLKAMGGKLFFNAQRRDLGRELFSVDLPPP